MDIKSNTPIACNLEALTAEQKERYSELRKHLSSMKMKIQELTDGYAISYPDQDQVILNLAEWITLEKVCCPFIQFTIEIGHVEQHVTLKLRGSKTAKMVLANALGLS